MMMRLFSIVFALFTLVANMQFASAVTTESTLKIPPMVPERSISTYVPSESAPGQGLAVNVIYPVRTRYKEGAPVAVVVPGGIAASGLEMTAHAIQSGFIEVRFAFPGGGKTGFASAGNYDFRGPSSQKALRDVLLFASGRAKDVQGRTVKQLVPEKVDTSNVGVIGWDNGGNLAAVTLAKYDKDLSFLNWIVFYESPLGSLFYPTALGGSLDLMQNKHYRQGTGATGHPLVDFRKLAYDPEASRNPGAHKKIGQPEIKGVLFFDENGDKTWEEELEFALPYSAEAGVDKQFYPPTILQAARRLGIFGKTWPKTVATIPEAEKHFQERDGSLYLTEIAREMPNLNVTVIGTVLDHLQRQPDHPHIALNYNSWLANKQKFVRLNPDPVYAGAVSGMNRHNFVDNKPGASIDASQMDEFLEPEGLVPDYVFVEAAAAELADRNHFKNYKETLVEPLVTYWNGALVAPTANDAKDKDKAKADAKDSDKSKAKTDAKGSDKSKAKTDAKDATAVKR